MSMLVNGNGQVDPNNVPLASLVAQEENVDVNFIKRNNFNNNAYRNNFGSNNYRPYPSNNSNSYGNSYGNSYSNNRNVPSELEVMLKDFINKQTAFNKFVDEKFDRIDTLASKVDSLALDVDILKSKVMSHYTKEGKNFATSNAIQVRIDDNMRLLSELHARWEREDEMARKDNLAKVCTITTSSKTETPNASKPPPTNGKSESVGKVPLTCRKVQKPIKNTPDKCAEIFRNMCEYCPFTFDENDFYFDGCNITEVIKFLQNLAETPNTSEINVAFTRLDIECNDSCSIILGRPFLRAAGAIIDMRDGI